MTKRMLIDATHPEETRVVVADNKQLLDYEYESAMRKQLRGNIFLAKVTRVEPSLQAAFVNYGGNRHGFLPFSEIHPDYYRIPIADREALLEEQRQALEEARRAEEEEDEEFEKLEKSGGNNKKDDESSSDNIETLDDETKDEAPQELGAGAEAEFEEEEDSDDEDSDEDEESDENSESEEDNSDDENKGNQKKGRHRFNRGRGRGRYRKGGRRANHRNDRVEMVGGDSIDGDRPIRPNLTRRYKIQEVIKRGQIMLVQVSKEERGAKGAAVTSYLSLPGRYCVLMPNSPRSGGVSRKIANYKDRKRLREILKEFNVPEGMSVIVRTAGVARTKTEIKRDLDYLLRLWDNIRTTTLESQAPALIYEEGELVKRAIRDIYERDMQEVIVEGDRGYKIAKDIMKMMIPSHAKRVKEYKDHKRSLYHYHGLEQQISGIGEPQVPLKSGGSLVIHPTEALVSIDVNSGRATKERHIEETALRTNLEAAEEVARQLRLRDLGGLVVIDFIDMEDRRNNGKVERKLKEALSTDRARLQVGRISSFGLLELSRQRISASVTETQFQRCGHCEGTGFIRTVDSMAIVVLRSLETLALEGQAAEVAVTVTTDVALYILNQKRFMLQDIENRYEMKILIHADPSAAPSFHEIEVLKTRKELEKEESAENNDNSEDQDEEESDDQSNDDNSNNNNKGNRNNRGKRNNRNRRNNRGRQQNKNDDNQDNNDGNEEAKSSDNKQEDEKDQKKGGRKPNTSKKDEVKEEASQEDKKDDEPKDEKPKRGRKKKDDKAEAEPKSSDDKPQEESKDEKPKRGRKKKDDVIEQSPPSNDDKPAKPTRAEQTHAREAEVVNEAPKQKKKGWWNKLTD